MFKQSMTLDPGTLIPVRSCWAVVFISVKVGFGGGWRRTCQVLRKPCHEVAGTGEMDHEIMVSSLSPHINEHSTNLSGKKTNKNASKNHGQHKQNPPQALIDAKRQPTKRASDLDWDSSVFTRQASARFNTPQQLDSDRYHPLPGPVLVPDFVVLMGPNR